MYKTEFFDDIRITVGYCVNFAQENTISLFIKMSCLIQCDTCKFVVK